MYSLSVVQTGAGHFSCFGDIWAWSTGCWREALVTHPPMCGHRYATWFSDLSNRTTEMAPLRIELRALCMKIRVLPPNCTPTPEVNVKQRRKRVLSHSVINNSYLTSKKICYQGISSSYISSELDEANFCLQGYPGNFIFAPFLWSPSSWELFRNCSLVLKLWTFISLSSLLSFLNSTLVSL